MQKGTLDIFLYSWFTVPYAEVVKLVYTPGLGPGASRRGGSSPLLGTHMNTKDTRYFAASMREDLPTVDLHGISDMKTAEEQLEKKLFLFFSRGEEICRVVHGIGTGKMKATVHALLQKNPQVEDFRMSEDGGSTIVLL